jgi:hypothetical protein
MIAHRGLILHIQQGTEAGTDSWFHNPASQVSAHFGAAKDGTLDQWVDTDDEAWAEIAGNPFWVSVEEEGNSGESLTGPQVASTAKLYAWLCHEYGLPLQSTDNPEGTGLGWHGMGGLLWGHPNCPGDPIKAQRPDILAQAAAIISQPTPRPPEPVEFQEANMLATLVTVPLAGAGDPNAGRGWNQWDPGFGRPPTVVSCFLQGPFPPRDGWGWPKDGTTPCAQVDGNAVVVTVVGGEPGAQVGVFVSVA